jgi:hypothetical protein
VVIDVLLSFRATGAYDEMIDLVEHRMGPALVRSTLVREQYAFALNRAGRKDRAEEVLLALIEERGPSSETYGILGRVYKDRWEAALAEGKEPLAGALLDKAIAAYRKGFEADWRDAYPGVNAVELMELRDPPDPDRHALLPVVRYALERRLSSGSPDYWDHATDLELALLQDDREGATRALGRALAEPYEGWMPASTAASLRRLREARERRSEDAGWIATLEETLQDSAN